MNINKKILAVFPITLYLIANMLFYSVIFNDYVNRKVFFITGFLFLCEIIFWIVIFYFVNSVKNIQQWEKYLIEGIFLTGIAATGIGRILLNSSPYVNDLLNSSTPLIYLLGSGRVLMLFCGFLLFGYVYKPVNWLIRLVAFLNIFIAFLIWVDFDNTLSSSVRIIMGLIAIIYISLFKENEMKEHENTLLSLQTSLISLEDKIEEKKLTVSTLKNRKADKEKITLEEKRLNNLNSQRQVILKDITSEKKVIEKIQKNLEIEHKLNGLKKEIHSIKKEVINEDETAFKVKYIDNNVRNIFVVSIIYIKAYISKKVFRQKVENYDQIKKVSKNIKVRIATSVILAVILSLCFLVTLKFISSAKEHYVSFGETNTTAVDTTEEMKKQKEAEEKAKILKAQEQADAVRIDSDAQDEEITAKLAGTFTSYSFDVDREVTVNKKIHAFKSASWSEPGDVIEPGTKLTVDKIISPAGYVMYHISSGDHQGQYITANEKFVSVDKKNDQLENFISRPVAIKFLTTQNIYSDESLSSVRSTYGNGAQLNINGIGISKNNRLVYHVTDGTFVPVNPVRVTEVNRESPKPKNNENDNKNTANTNSQNNQKRTTR